MSRVRRFRIAVASITAVVAGALFLGIGTAGANPTVPTVPATVPEAVVSTQALDDAGFVADVNEMRGSPSDPQMLNAVLAQTGSSTGILVISGVILLVIGGSLVGSRRVYGD